MAIGSYTFKTVAVAGAAGGTWLGGINNAGEVTGYYVPDAPGGYRIYPQAFTDTNGIVSLLGGAGLISDQTMGNAINNQGQVAGTQGSSPVTVTGFLWSPDNTAQRIDSTPSWTFGTVDKAYGINDAGQVVGADFVNQHVGFTWQNGTMSFIQVPNANTEAHGINNAGVIVGTANNYGFIDVGGQISLMAIPGATITDARSINSADTVAGSYFDGTHWHGWIDDGTLHFIDAPGAADTWITGINDSGTIAGYSDTASGGITQGFIATDPPPTDPVSLGVDADYLAAFGREGDSAGVAFWTKELETTTITLRDFVWALTTSPEGQWLHGGQTNAQYVDSLYVNALGRHADAGGQAVWAGALQSGAGRYDVLAAIAQSPEGQMHFAATHG